LHDAPTKTTRIGVESHVGEEMLADPRRPAQGEGGHDSAPRPAEPVASSRAWDHGPHPRLALVAWIAVAAVAVGLAWPAAAAVGDWLHPPRPFPDDSRTPWNAILLALIQAGWSAWVFALGASVGSFLNVVVHRLPAGRSVIFGRSACPACGTGIRPDDNLPILGWLRLGGRCRHCGILIDARYPIVEAIMAGFCLGLCHAELLSGGVTLPIRDPHDSAGLLGIVIHESRDLIGILLYHVVAVATLTVWALIAADRRPLPARHVAATLAVLGLVPAAFPWLHPVPLVHPRIGVGSAPVDPLEPGWLWQGLLVSLAGMAAGGGLGAAWQAVGRLRGCGGLAAEACQAVGRTVPAIPAQLALVGTVSGWQAVPAVALLGLAVRAAGGGLSRCLGGRRGISPEMAIASAAVVHLVAWRWIVVAWSPSGS